MKYLIIAFIAILTIASCNKNEKIENEDFLIFGHFFGECGGEGCVEIFKIEDGELFEDTLDQYPSATGNNYSWQKLDDDLYQQAKDLVDLFPDELLNENEITIGMPDAGDWGGIVVGTKSRVWLVDYADENIPNYLSEFTAEIKERITILQ
ncbi:MAG: hypothetical protein HKO66_07770 [Saprospiraceae bacterium]|nr:hypothetical protein [Bacteroidia bacterium]NNE15866.1 hypothetical protein [Saprospiraceae bacterium]NNL92113.1 hypothetical protein [Saprospiraceae bacterium]